MKYIFLTFIIIIIGIIIIIIKSISYPSKIRKAEELLSEGDISGSNEIIRKILSKKQDYIPARYIKAQILMKQNQYVLAIAELNAILNMADVKKFIKELDIHNHLAFLYHETNNFQKEIEEYKVILTFNSDDIMANYRIGHALYSQKDYRKAKEHLLKAITLDQTLIDVYRPLGISCYNISDYDNSETFLINSLKTSGDHSEAEFYLGNIYKMKKDYDNAVKRFNNAKTNRKFFLKSIFLLGEIYYELNEYSLAIDILEQGLNNLKEKSDESLAYRYLLAECYEMENKIKEAVHHWEKIYTENPNFRSTKLKLDSYRDILQNNCLMSIFVSSLEELQPLIVEMISSLNYNIISKERINANEYQYKAYNIKRINDPPILIFFNRSTREITEGNIIEFYKKLTNEKCKNGIYITTSKYSIRAKSGAQSKLIELYDGEFVNKVIEKTQLRKKHN
jgi:tetratricopeptide (TPR) repeat protein